MYNVSITYISTRIMYDDFADLDYSYDNAANLDEDYTDTYDLDEEYMRHNTGASSYQELAYTHYA